MCLEALDIQTVLVPAGAEYKAVKRGLNQVKNSPSLIAIPAGPVGLKKFLAAQNSLNGGLLLMGLGGSLSPEYSVGRTIALTQVWNGFETGQLALDCDPKLTKQIATRLELETGTGVTCDRVITSAQEKRLLGDRYKAAVVDMEAAVLLKQFPDKSIAVLRVISDDAQHDLPDISEAISPDGSLRPQVLALRFLSNPVAAARLIRDSLIGLKALETLTKRLFENAPT